ncbi:MAG TPA: hypothetical protein DIU15_16480, partial [Deltaproteobacteria bacterium]|nr:hypothetical protein [Deltaproteobacteria bacterium]
DHEYIHSYTAISTGSYLIKASLWSDMGGTPGSGYSLDVDITYGASCIEDTFEEDDYPFLATPVPMWVSDYTVTDMTACPADSDWFETFVTDTEWLSVDVTFAHAQGDIDLKVYDPSGALRLWSFGWADFESALIDVDSSGWWSVEVYIIDGSDDLYPGNTYDINISRL